MDHNYIPLRTETMLFLFILIVVLSIESLIILSPSLNQVYDTGVGRLEANWYKVSHIDSDSVFQELERVFASEANFAFSPDKLQMVYQNLIKAKKTITQKSTNGLPKNMCTFGSSVSNTWTNGFCYIEKANFVRSTFLSNIVNNDTSALPDVIQVYLGDLLSGIISPAANKNGAFDISVVIIVSKSKRTYTSDTGSILHRISYEKEDLLSRKIVTGQCKNATLMYCDDLSVPDKDSCNFMKEIYEINKKMNTSTPVIYCDGKFRKIHPWSQDVWVGSLMSYKGIKPAISYAIEESADSKFIMHEPSIETFSYVVGASSLIVWGQLILLICIIIKSTCIQNTDAKIQEKIEFNRPCPIEYNTGAIITRFSSCIIILIQISITCYFAIVETIIVLQINKRSLISIISVIRLSFYGTVLAVIGGAQLIKLFNGARYSQRYRGRSVYTCFTLCTISGIISMFISFKDGNLQSGAAQCGEGRHRCMSIYNTTYFCFIGTVFLSPFLHVLLHRIVAKEVDKAVVKDSEMVERRSSFEKYCLSGLDYSKTYRVHDRVFIGGKIFVPYDVLLWFGFVHLKDIGLIKTKDLWIIVCSSVLPKRLKRELYLGVYTWKTTDNCVHNCERMMPEAFQISLNQLIIEGNCLGKEEDMK